MFFFVNYIYLENSLYIEHIDNIFTTVNKINLKLQLLIDYKNKYKSSSRSVFINKINKLMDKENMYEYNKNYIINHTIKKTDIYKHIISTL
tara:strand:- start:152 stop:424 length:273 start_codon:yes stop_codon:yes gene_type:complete